jgi:hypothetical protein
MPFGIPLELPRTYLEPRWQDPGPLPDPRRGPAKRSKMAFGWFFPLCNIVTSSSSFFVPSYSFGSPLELPRGYLEPPIRSPRSSQWSQERSRKMAQNRSKIDFGLPVGCPKAAGSQIWLSNLLPSPIGITSECLDPNGFETAEKCSNNDKLR